MTGDPITPAEAERYLNRPVSGGTLVQGGTSPGASPGTPTVNLAAATEQTDEIRELARGLMKDPKLIFDYVHNHVDYVPYFGSKKGATLTYYDGSGNDFDQASLMIALLRASGYTAEYQYGTMEFPFGPGSPLYNWLGTTNSCTTVLSSGGIPFEFTAGAITIRVSRVWVRANINGTSILFDPAFKTYGYHQKIDLAAAMRYARAALIASAGGTFTSDYVQNLNEAGLASKLTEFATNLIQTLRTQHANKTVSEVLGRRYIVETELREYPTSLPFPTNVRETWTDVPVGFTSKLRIQHPGIDLTVAIPEIAGKRLTVTYAQDRVVRAPPPPSRPIAPDLRLNGELIARGSETAVGTKYDLILTIDHPFAAKQGTYADQTATFDLLCGSTVAIFMDFGGTSETLIRHRQRELDLNRLGGSDDNSERVLGETLNILGLSHQQQKVLAKRLMEDIADASITVHHSIGAMRQESSYFVDVRMFSASWISDWEGSHNSFLRFHRFTDFHSASEHGSIEQIVGTNNPAVSTIKLLHLANAKGQKLFLGESNNFAAIRSQLQGYPTSLIDRLQEKVRSGNARWVILPESGKIALNDWTGYGYLEASLGTNQGCLCIAGNFFGGYGTKKGSPPPEAPKKNAPPRPESSQRPETPTPVSREPVELAGGAYLFDHNDLSLGPGTPRGLSFVRSYHSAQSLVSNSFGFGWTHSYDIRVGTTSKRELGLGSRQVTDAAALIVAFYAMFDLPPEDKNFTNEIASIFISKWAMDRLIGNAIDVHLGTQVLTYAKLPGGSFNPPPGITTKLIENGNGRFSLLERFGTRFDFNEAGRIERIIDIDGNTALFAYDANANLTEVRDAFGRTLTLTYNGPLITGLRDSTGRSVRYDYDSMMNLVSYTDPEGKIWHYGYDARHQITSLTNPLGITTTSNVYNSLGQVTSQIVPVQSGTNVIWNFYFSGYRNVEEAPNGSQSIYFFDQTGNAVGQQNALGQRYVEKRDGQNHVVETIDPKGSRSRYIYNRNQNLIIGFNPLGQFTRYIYDSEFRLTDQLDFMAHRTRSEYDAKHHLSRSIDALGNTLGFSYYPNGLLGATTNGRSVVTTLTYDAFGHLQSSKVSDHPAVAFTYDQIGRLTSLTDQVGSKTSFAYDRRGLLTNRTDALGRTSILEYDNAGQLVASTDRNRTTVKFEYNPNGKVRRKLLPDGSSITFTYDDQDNLLMMQDSIGATRYAYDAVNRLVAMTNAHGFVISNAYDAAGNLVRLTYPGAKVVSYAYDALNRLQSVSNWLGQVTSYGYDGAGRLINQTNFNGTRVLYEYDDAHRLINLENRKSDGMLICAYRFALDGSGNRTNIVQLEPLVPATTNSSLTYRYNPQRNRLTEAVSSDGSTGLVLASNTSAYVYDEEGQLRTNLTIRITQDIRPTMRFPPGPIITTTDVSNTQSFTFDALQRLAAIRGSSSESQFAYDGLDRRLEARRGGVVTRYIYDVVGNLIAEADASNTVTRYYVHGGGLLALITESGVSYCYHYNAIGSTIALTDSNQNTVNQYAFLPFGEIITERETIPQSFKFVGRHGVLAEPNGFYYMRARYYDPMVGRFVSEDPSGLTGGDVNLYAYASNNPLTRIDPTGLRSDYEVSGRNLNARGYYAEANGSATWEEHIGAASGFLGLAALAAGTAGLGVPAALLGAASTGLTWGNTANSDYPSLAAVREIAKFPIGYLPSPVSDVAGGFIDQMFAQQMEFNRRHRVSPNSLRVTDYQSPFGSR